MRACTKLLTALSYRYENERKERSLKNSEHCYSQEYPLRLTQKDIEAIQKCFKETFADTDKLWIFGSRTDLNKRGGDIDLYVETSLSSSESLSKKITFSSNLIGLIGDQKIDIVVNYENAKQIDIYIEAKKTGVKLV